MDVPDADSLIPSPEQLVNKWMKPIVTFSNGRSVFNAQTDSTPFQNINSGFKTPHAVSFKFNSQTKFYRRNGSPDIKTKFSAGVSEEAVAVCECDRRVISDLASSIPNAGSLNYPANQCQKAHIPTHGECCKHSNGLYDMINPMVYCCGNNGPKPAGTCGNGQL